MRKFGKKMLVFGMSAALAASAGTYAYAANSKGGAESKQENSSAAAERQNAQRDAGQGARDAGNGAKQDARQGAEPRGMQGAGQGSAQSADKDAGEVRSQAAEKGVDPGRGQEKAQGGELKKPAGEFPEEDAKALKPADSGIPSNDSPNHDSQKAIPEGEGSGEKQGKEGRQPQDGQQPAAPQGEGQAQSSGQQRDLPPALPAGAMADLKIDGGQANGQLPPAPPEHGGSDGVARSDGTARPEDGNHLMDGQFPPAPPEHGGSDGVARSDGTARPEDGNHPMDGQFPPAPPEHGGSDGVARSDGTARPEGGNFSFGGFGGGQMDGMNNGKPGGMGSSNAPSSYNSANTLRENSENQNYSSASDSENAVLVDGSSVSLKGGKVQKSGNSSSEDADFYGINAAVLANNGASLTIENVEIATDGSHANAVFSYGSGTEINISNSSIRTSGNNSGGLMTTGGAALNASNLTVQTSGNSSAAIRSDRGGGTVHVEDGSYRSSGTGSPAIYSTADISVAGATLQASNSEAVVIEGGNSVTLTDSSVSGNNQTLNGQSTQKTNVLIYQSMSGDASEGSSSFTMNGGTLSAGTGSMFHVTNVSTSIRLSNVKMEYASDSSVLLDASADSWGNSGRNGGNVDMSLSQQSIEGDINIDSVSSLALSLADASSYKGAINQGNASSNVSVSLESGSSWTLTGDSYISAFDGDLSQVNTNGYKLYVNGVAVK